MGNFLYFQNISLVKSVTGPRPCLAMAQLGLMSIDDFNMIIVKLILGFFLKIYQSLVTELNRLTDIYLNICVYFVLLRYLKGLYYYRWIS